MSTTGSLRHTAAIHEAGHAVVAWALGLKVRALSIEEGGKGESCIEHSGQLPLLDRIAVAAAGMAATDLLNLPVWHEAGFSDEVKIVNLLDQYSDDQEARDQMENSGHVRQQNSRQSISLAVRPCRGAGARRHTRRNQIGAFRIARRLIAAFAGPQKVA